MTIKLNLHRYFWIILLALLVACGPLAPARTATPSATNVASSTATVETLTALPTFTPVVKPPTNLPTYTPPVALPTLELLPSPTAPTPLPTMTPLPASLPKFPLDRYVMLFIKDGDLYFQDGNHSPVNLLHVAETAYDYYKSFKISDDNQRVVFFSNYDSIYSINTDGTPKKSVLPSGWRDHQLWGTNFGSVDFVPGTHQIIFRTYLCTSFDTPSTCISSIYLTDSDTGENRKLADLGFSGPDIRKTFQISPNGKMVAISTMSSVDIIDMEGKIIRHDVLPFKPNTPDILFPSVFWLPDSSGLIVALPNALFDNVAFNYVPAYTIWRYKINANIAVQIPLDPPPMAFNDLYRGIQVSPDGKWIIYGAIGGGTDVYLGNLANGQTEIFGKATQANFSWAPDSKHFIVTGGGSALGTIDPPILMLIGNVGGWIDDNHIFLYPFQKGPPKLCIAEIVSGGLKIYDLGFDQNVRLVLIKPK